MKMASGWTDVWLSKHEKNLRRNPGHTYDQKKNGMLKGSRYRSRLDRVLVHTPDSVWQDSEWEISLQGTTQIRHVTYELSNTLTLPVYPSDHFGLLTTFKRRQPMDETPRKQG